MKSRILPVKVPPDISSSLVGLSGFVKTHWQQAQRTATAEMMAVCDPEHHLKRGLGITSSSWLETGVRSTETLVFPDTNLSTRSALLDAGGGALMLLPGKPLVKAAAMVGLHVGARVWDVFDSKRASSRLGRATFE